MLTPWGEALDKNAVLQEYPRPQLVRESYYNLNGLWDYAITASDACPGAWDGEILVPFSPEAPLSGVGRILKCSGTGGRCRLQSRMAGGCCCTSEPLTSGHGCTSTACLPGRTRVAIRPLHWI